LSPEPSSAEPSGSSRRDVATSVTSPAFALVAADGSLVAADEVFDRLVGADVLSTPEVASAVGAITVGNQEVVGFMIDSPNGAGLVTRAEAVLSAQDRRLALLEVRLPRPVARVEALPAWFASFAAGSSAIVWLKDLEGHYLWVNREYSRALEVEADRVVGHLDSELDQLEAVDGPRIRGRARSPLAADTPRDEPLSLEYTIPAFDRRPALAALRFPVIDPSGTPLAVCGVASPADHGEVAQEECADLLGVVAWFRDDPQTLRAAVLDRWRIRAVRPQGSLGLEAPAAAAPAPVSSAAAAAPAGLEPAPVAVDGPLAQAHGRDAEPIRAGLERIRELEAMVASASAAGVAASRSAERVVELQREVQALNAALTEQRDRMRELATDDGEGGAALRGERARHAAEMAAVCEESQALREKLTALRGQLEAAEARHSAELSAHARHEDELSGVGDRVRTELNAANQRHRLELSQLRDRYEALLAEHSQLTESEHQARVDAEALRDQLSAALAQLRELQTARAASRDQIARLERAVVAATAAAAAPAEPMAAEPGPAPAEPGPAPAEPVLAPAERMTPPAEPAPPPSATPDVTASRRVPAGSAQTPAPEPQLGWDQAAQHALANALSGCLNFRSILSESVRLIGTAGGWDAVVAWEPDQRDAKLSCAATWVRSPVQMAALETSMWQVRQSPTASAVGAAAASSEVVWISPSDADGDRHLATLQADGISTVVLVPVRQQGQTSAVLELCTRSAVRQSAEADAALRSIEVEVAGANQRLVDAASAGQWGRRRR
jgi:PAS domain-containing protein/predicted  nucleic acid-binding Zn-ribbon protein